MPLLKVDIAAEDEMQNHLLTKLDVATLFGISTRTVNVWLSKRLLPHYRRGNVLRFRPDEIEGVLASMRIPAKGEVKRKAGRITTATGAQ